VRDRCRKREESGRGERDIDRKREEREMVKVGGGGVHGTI
jgi:hypothetical protein